MIDLNVSVAREENRALPGASSVCPIVSINHVCSCGIPVTEIDKTLNISRAMPGWIRAESFERVRERKPKNRRRKEERRRGRWEE